MGRLCNTHQGWDKLNLVLPPKSYAGVTNTDDLNIAVINLFKPTATFHIETNHSICSTNQIPTFYLKWNTGMKLVKNRKKIW